VSKLVISATFPAEDTPTALVDAPATSERP
jgi:hypothetical protein